MAVNEKTKALLVGLLVGITLGWGACTEPGNQITFWVMPNSTDNAHQRWLESKKNEFYKETGIEISFEIISWSDAWIRIKEGVSSTNCPDVIQLRSTWTASYAQQGLLKEINPDDFGGRVSYLKNTFSTVIYNEKFFGLPWIGETTALFGNDELLGDAGTTMPDTIERLFETGKKIVARTGPGTALLLPGIGSADLLDYWSVLFYANGGKYLTDDRTITGFAGPAGIQATQTYLDLFAENMAPQSGLEFSTKTCVELFGSGKAALCFLTPSAAHRLLRANPDLTLADGILLAGTHSGAAAINGSNLVIPKNSKNPVKATRWINFLLGEDNLFDYTHNVVSMLPSKTKVLSRPEFTQGFWAAFSRTAQDAIPYPASASWQMIEQEATAALKQLLQTLRVGLYKPEQIEPVLKNAALNADEALKTNQ